MWLFDGFRESSWILEFGSHLQKNYYKVDCQNICFSREANTFLTYSTIF